MTTELETEVKMGESIAKFMQTDVGLYLSRRAELDRFAALEQLAELDASDDKFSEKFNRLQWQARTPDLFLRWVTDAIEAGKLSRNEIEENQGE